MIKLKRLLIVAVIITAAALLMGVTAAAADLAYGAATVSATSLNIRSGPSTEHDRLMVVSGGTRLVILSRNDGEWFKVNYQGTVGYVDASYLKDVLTAENFNATGTITASEVRMREKPNTDSDIIMAFDENTVVDVIGINNGWFKITVNGKNGYVRSDLMEITGAPSGAVVTSSGNSSLGQQIVNTALQFLGYDYVYGAESPKDGFDCSGLVYYVYGQYGYDLKRTASQQFKHNGRTVSKSELQQGDLVFFSSNGYSVTHVGMYIGDDQFIHASTSNTGVIISDLTSAYYIRVWFGAKRII